MKLTDAQISERLEDARTKPAWARTSVTGNNEAMRIQVKAGTTVVTSEGVYEFAEAGDWLLLPSELWAQTLKRLRVAEARMTGKGDGGPKGN